MIAAVLLENYKSLMQLVLKKYISIPFFCEEFEYLSNFEEERNLLTEKQKMAINELFNKMIFQAPFPNEIGIRRNYAGEAVVFIAIENIYQRLCH
jgi:hypothetical protein